MNLWVCGVDEAGRGPLAGPVCAAAVILDPNRLIDGIADSKKLSEARRDALAVEIKLRAVSFFVAWATVEEIDALNILQATMLAMQRAVLGLSPPAVHALVDGNRLPHLPITAEAIIRGDQSVPSISAASILAKTARDAMMYEIHERYPEYGFDQHKGYDTPGHRIKLMDLGPIAVHRRSFAPVRAAMTRHSPPTRL